MAYYSDLSKYEYHNIEENTINIGWLDIKNEYCTGVVPAEFINKLWDYLRYNIIQMRGFHECNICPDKTGYLSVKRDGEELKLGSAEIRVIGIDGKIYAAPNLIYHYVTKHNYRPPDEFVEAVLNGFGPNSTEYIKYINTEFKGVTKQGIEDKNKRSFNWKFWK